ncbi:MAG TPA: polyphosphate polymerase domain-containing protein [Clostridia bacterium]|nr:polyphosphate polymerase domain-containing protein [Clostridia bacterium]
MSIEVFNRYEKKYLLDTAAYQKLQGPLLEHMEPDEYNKSHEFYTISNIYYDTGDDYLIKNSMAKPEYKEKLRLRAYGVPRADDKVFLEIKKKFKGLVNKRRTILKLEEAYEFVNGGVRPELKKYMNRQVLNEIEYMLKLYGLEPKLYLAYDRKAMFSRENRDLRITFDSNIKTRRYDLRMESGSYGEPLLRDGEWLMEVKAENNIPLWLSRLLSEYAIYSTSFSKYGTEYRRRLMEERNIKGERITCSKQYSEQPQTAPQYHWQPQY